MPCQKSQEGFTSWLFSFALLDKPLHFMIAGIRKDQFSNRPELSG
ncbi:hypothetical protein AB434_2368 [Heyndrickxia coagulans]|uniref:Uncharacterized protein n=1 Tax=Heyndrickxia coagulans TaxID=1398 RepID=A0A0C5CAM5_HEYCO|nr:hypothetical protein SB48_HM08orf04686 [Heyndrickxia coagulans]AKN54773.1 hypothetical protein AB434_2368 [Heyndrickxia coagulans]KWZ77859.1 hypothetical protein HMPREF3213_03164 [Heyndrickxia coagulans]